MVSLFVLFVSTSDWGDRPRTMFNWRISSWEFRRILRCSTFLVFGSVFFSMPSSKISGHMCFSRLLLCFQSGHVLNPRNTLISVLHYVKRYEFALLKSCQIIWVLKNFGRLCFSSPRICCAFFKNGAVWARPRVTAFRFSGIFNVNFSFDVSSFSLACSIGNKAGKPDESWFPWPSEGPRFSRSSMVAMDDEMTDLKSLFKTVKLCSWHTFFHSSKMRPLLWKDYFRDYMNTK